MLFTYRYLKNHPIEKLQSWLDYLVLEVWCKAEGEYDISLLDGCPELKEVVEDFHFSESQGGDLFNRTIEEVFYILKTWPEDEKTVLAESYLANNAIEALCEGSKQVPITYKALEFQDAGLSKKLRKFYKELYINILHLKPIHSRIGRIEEHCEKLTTLNDEDRCPFCGLHRVKGQYAAPYREAYDHYLPKHIYPFNSVNFRNLAPMCHECNSTYKIAKDPLYKPILRDPLINRENRRRKAFYPYSANSSSIQIKVDIKTQDINQIAPQDIDVSINSSTHSEQTEVWKELFCIEKRYKEVFCGKNDGKYWYTQMADELLGFSAEALRQTRFREKMESLHRRAARYPWADLNFIKLPFLEGCERAGLFRENKILSR